MTELKISRLVLLLVLWFAVAFVATLTGDYLHDLLFHGGQVCHP